MAVARPSGSYSVTTTSAKDSPNSPEQGRQDHPVSIEFETGNCGNREIAIVLWLLKRAATGSTLVQGQERRNRRVSYIARADPYLLFQGSSVPKTGLLCACSVGGAQAVRKVEVRSGLRENLSLAGANAMLTAST